MQHHALPKSTDRPDVVILAAGDFPHGQVAHALLVGAREVICCDGAAEEFCATGAEPVAVVGDFDSLSEELRTRLADRLHHRPDQDVNDLWKALTLAIERGARRVTVLGAFGRREDHSIGNLMLCAARMNEVEIQMVGDRGVFSFIDRDSTFESFAGEQVSLFTLSPTTEISTIGLRYEPPQNRLSAMWQGVSNESLGAEFTIRTNAPTIVYRLF
ncbi:MAG: thiamine diphosphokinase [Rikenellaceae bacterium]|nr:thiamine diphosphokinase [Rikenellaceae bacterium]